jgi:hypothetical protein
MQRSALSYTGLRYCIFPSIILDFECAVQVSGIGKRPVSALILGDLSLNVADCFSHLSNSASCATIMPEISLRWEFMSQMCKECMYLLILAQYSPMSSEDAFKRLVRTTCAQYLSHGSKGRRRRRRVAEFEIQMTISEVFDIS